MKNSSLLKIASFLILAIMLFVQCKTDVPRNQDSIKVRLAAEPDRLNPFLTGSGYASQVADYLFLPLQQYDPRSLQLKPILVKQRPEVQSITEGEFKGGVAYTFEILDEATWDNGSPVLASDYLFTMKVMWNSEVPMPHYRAYFDFLGDIIIDENNPRRFTVYTNKIYFLTEEALSSIALYPEYIYDQDALMQNFSLKELIALKESNNEILKQFAEQFSSSQYSHEPESVVGCGGYALEKWDKGQSILLKRKTNWWGIALAKQNDLLKTNPAEIEFKIISDNTAAITALKDGALDVLSEIEPASFVELQDNDFVKEQFDFHTPPYLSYSYLGLNTKRVQLEDKQVRRALAHLINLDQSIESVMHDLGQRVVGPIHPAKPTYHKGLEPVPFDIDKANRLLKEAGWIDSDQNGVLDKTLNGQKIEMSLTIIYTAANKVAENMCLLFKETAAKAGVLLELKGMEFNALINDYRARDYDIVFGTWSQMPGPDDLKQIWHTESDTPKGFNRTAFGDEASDTIIDSIRLTLDEETRNQLYLSIQERIYEDQNYIFLYAPLERIAISRKYESNTSARRPGFFVNQFESKE